MKTKFTLRRIVTNQAFVWVPTITSKRDSYPDWLSDTRKHQLYVYLLWGTWGLRLCWADPEVNYPTGE
jgi:hypothetical protein